MKAIETTKTIISKIISPMPHHSLGAHDRVISKLAKAIIIDTKARINRALFLNSRHLNFFIVQTPPNRPQS